MIKRLLLIFSILVFAANSHAILLSKGATTLTGGDVGALDSYDGSTLNDGDMAFVRTGETIAVYKLDADSGLTESSPYIISPDSSAGDKRWIRQGFGPFNFVSSYGGNISTACTAIGTSAETTLYVDMTVTVSVDTDLSAYTNITYKKLNAGQFSVANTKTLTLYSANKVEADGQFFSGDGTVAWGIAGNIMVDWYPSVPKAFASLKNNSSLTFRPKTTYTASSTCNISVSNVKIYGNKSTLTIADDTDGIDINPSAQADGSSTLTWIDIYDLYVYTADSTPTKAGIKSRDVQHLNIERCKLWGHKYGLDIVPRDRNFITNNWFFNNEIGIYIPDYYTALTSQTTRFAGNTFSKGTNGLKAFSIEALFESIHILGGAIAGDYDYGIYSVTGTSVGASDTLTIKDVSFEQATTGDYLIYIDNTAADKLLENLYISGCELGGGNATAIHAEKTGSANVIGNLFAQGGSGVPIELDNDCAYWNIAGNRISDTGYPNINYANATYIHENHRGRLKWISNGSVRGYSQSLRRSNSDVSTSGGGTDDLATYAITAGLIPADGGLKVLAAGTKVDTANDHKTIALVWGSTSITVIDGSQTGDDWRVEAEIVNTASAAQRITWKAWDGVTVTQGYETATEDTASSVTLKFTGAVADTTADSITQTMFQVNLF